MARDRTREELDTMRRKANRRGLIAAALAGIAGGAVAHGVSQHARQVTAIRKALEISREIIEQAEHGPASRENAARTSYAFGRLKTASEIMPPSYVPGVAKLRKEVSEQLDSARRISDQYKRWRPPATREPSKAPVQRKRELRRPQAR